MEGVGEPFCVFLDSLDHLFFVVDVEGEYHRTASNCSASELGARAPAESAQGFLRDGIVEIQRIQAGELVHDLCAAVIFFLL